MKEKTQANVGVRWGWATRLKTGPLAQHPAHEGKHCTTFQPLLHLCNAFSHTLQSKNKTEKCMQGAAPNVFENYTV